jgi:hypothetical protein
MWDRHSSRLMATTARGHGERIVALRRQRAGFGVQGGIGRWLCHTRVRADAVGGAPFFRLRPLRGARRPPSPRDRIGQDPDHSRGSNPAKAATGAVCADQRCAASVPPADEECAGDSEKYPLRSPSALGRARGMRSAVPPARVADSGQRRWHGAKRHPHTLAGSDRKCQILVDTGRMMINIAPFDTSGVADTSESCPSERSTHKRRGPDGPRSAIRDPRSAQMVSGTGARERTRSAVVAVHLAERVPSIPSCRPSSMSCRERPLKFHRTTVPRPNATPPGLRPLYPSGLLHDIWHPARISGMLG